MKRNRVSLLVGISMRLLIMTGRNIKRWILPLSISYMALIAVCVVEAKNEVTISFYHTSDIHENSANLARMAQFIQDQKAKNLTGEGKKLDAIYGISASIFEGQVKAGNGNSKDLQSWMLKAQSNPKAFFDGLSPQQKAAIKQLAGQIENSRKPSSP